MTRIRCSPLTAFFVLVVISSGTCFAQEEPGGPTGREVIFPIVHSAFVDGSLNLSTSLTFLNLSDEPVSGRLVAYRDDGTPTRITGLCTLFPDQEPDLDDVEREFEISPGGATTLDTGPDNEGRLPDFAGWGRVTFEQNVEARGSSTLFLRTTPNNCVFLSGTGADVATRQFASSDSTGPPFFLEAVQVSAVRPGTLFRARAVNRNSQQSAFAIVNPSQEETAEVRVQRLGVDGENYEALEIAVPALNRVTRFTSELFGAFKGGILQFESNVPIAVAGIVVVEPDEGGLWVGLPVERVDLHEQLLFNWGKWQSRSGAKSYEFEMEWTTSLSLSGYGRIHIVVEDGNVVSVVRVDDGTTLSPGLGSTVDELFAELERVLQGSPFRFNITYHPVDGFPRKADVDPVRGAIDDEFAFQIFDLVLSP